MKPRARGAERSSCPVSVGSAAHYMFGGICDGWRLLDHEGLTVIEERMPPGGLEPWHLHERSRQFFYVRSGCITIDRKDGPTCLWAGEGLHVPPRVAHQVSNESGEDAVFLVISSPSTIGDRKEVPRPRPATTRRRPRPA